MTKVCRSISLVAESLPLTKKGEKKKAIPFEDLPEEYLIPLDQRHGVFPNLVAKPFFSAIMNAHAQNGQRVVKLLVEIDEVMNNPQRRFNVFEDKITNQKDNASSKFKYSTSYKTKLGRLHKKDNLWVLFGYQTLGGTLRHLLRGGELSTRSIVRKSLQNCVRDFIHYCWKVDSDNCEFIFPETKPTSGSGRMGFIHRLCTEDDEVGNGAIRVLESGIKGYRKENNISKRDTNTLIDKFRSMVPLMHNEAYQTGPHAIGNTQSHFVGYARHATTPPTLYWKVIGEAIVSRTFNEWVEKPSSAEE